MSKYTTEVRWICESEARKVRDDIPDGIAGIDVITTVSAPLVFNFDFPMFDENYRLVLEKKILRHFYTREICEETVGLWKLRMWDKLNVIMPYYNKLYESELYKFNPLYDVDLTRDHKTENSGDSNTVENNNTQKNVNENRNKVGNTSGSKSDVTDGNSSSNERTDDSENSSSSHSENSNGSGWNLFSDTPQGSVNIFNDDIESVADNSYLTNATKTTNSEANSGSGTQKVDRVGNSNKNDVTHMSNNEVAESNSAVSENNSNNESFVGSKNVANNINNVENYIEHVKGKQGAHTYSAMILEFRKTLLNIDEMILRDLEGLFFGLWE